MRFISWNVNGLRAVCKKGFEDIFFCQNLYLKNLCGMRTETLPGYRKLTHIGKE